MAEHVLELWLLDRLIREEEETISEKLSMCSSAS